MISREALEQFKEIWKQEIGEEIPDDVAMEEALSLLTLFQHTHKPLKKSWVEEYEKEKQMMPISKK